VDCVASALRQVTSELVLLANDAEAAHWLPGIRVLPDSHAGAGGLAGVEAALHAGHDVLVVAWDMPFVNAKLLELLIADARVGDADVVLPDSNSPYGFEPFCAYYSARVQPALSAFLEKGGGAAREFIARVNVRRVPLSMSQRAGDPDRLFFSVNTPEDLLRARAIATSAE
jgi:molybdopterin-guanine dinucleotide biosynthesis protein A